MSTYTSEPGTRLAGRYRLVNQVSSGAGWGYWKATDETLARSVTVLTFGLGFPRLAETVTAARAASRLTDPRFAQVFDVEDSEELAYVVTEWVVGESLLDMLAEGPLEAPRAVALIVEAAQALAKAHAAGLAHLCLSPACLHWTPVGGVKISGLGLDAALAGPAAVNIAVDDPAADDATADADWELADTRDLARLLYAALTGYWPGPGGSGLPQAPEADGAPCTPRQVSAAVPASIDAVTCQALFQRPSRHGPALSTPAMFADALARVAPPSPLPIPELPLPGTRSVPGPVATDTAPGPVAFAPPGGGYPKQRSRSPVNRAVLAVASVVVLAAAGLAAWSASRNSSHTPGPQALPRHSSVPSAAAAVVLKPVGASSVAGEDAPDVQNVIDASTATAWHSSYYIGSPHFGGLPKQGVGVVLDMGKAVRLSQVVVQFGTSCCAHAEIEIGNNADQAPDGFTAVATSDTAANSTTFNVTSNATGRYVLIWITYLPQRAGYQGQYQAQIYNVLVRGPAVTQSG